jgi:biopolymer transport protein TolQ
MLCVKENQEAARLKTGGKCGTNEAMKHLVFTLLPPAANGDYFDLLRNASPISKAVLVLLLVFSVISWAVIIFKSIEYSRARGNALRFLDYFRKSKNLHEIHKFSGVALNNPLGEIFRYGYREMSLQMGPNYSPDHLKVDSVQRALLRGSNREILRLEKLNGFLATTAAVTPFIGLFGTVWGIMGAFSNIGQQQNANLATVAPGIAEALIATAMGLFAAIPAVIFYNFLLSKLRGLIAMMDDFVSEFLNLCEKMV